jgi:hypothetical protein
MPQIPNNRQNPFRLPENYFEQFSEDLQIRISEEKLEEKFGKKNPFSVPNNYFENLDFTSFNKKQTFLPNKTKFSILIKTSFSIAAGVILFFAVRFLFFDQNTSKNTANYSISSDSLKPTEIDIYEDIDESTIVAVFSEENKKETISPTISDEEMLNYVADYSDESELIAALY